ncbi:MAG TPA: O-antigen ligase family protein [Anaerolineae bacterium]
MSAVLAHLESILFDPRPHRGQLALAGLLLAAALLAALLVAAAGPVLAVVILPVLIGGILMLRDTRWGFVVLFAVIGLLPFAALPFKIGFTPTFLDVALLALYFVWVMRIATRRQDALVGTSLALPILVFVLLAVFAFANGLQYNPPTSTTVRGFVELLLGILSFFLVINNLRQQADVDLLARLIILAGAAAAVIAIVMYFIPTTWTIRILDSLSRLNYPGGAGALRYIEDDPANAMRAIGTQIDPNVAGGFLMMMAALALPQLVSARPLFPRSLVALFLALDVFALYLTHSRSALVGLVVAALLLGVVRYRKLVLIVALGIAALLLVPQTQAYVAHFMAGIELQDQATQMRLGEYKDAIALITRYPWFGVGFSGSPDPSLYVGVSSVYLLMAEEMGVVGVALFLLIVAGVLLSLARAWLRQRRDPRREALILGLAGAVAAGMVGGLLDHYLFNLVYPHMSTVFWILLGLGMAATSLDLDRLAAPSAGSAARQLAPN